MKKHLVAVSLVLACSACKKDSAPPVEAPPVLAPGLTDEKVSAYVVYETEMLASTRLVTKMAFRARQQDKEADKPLSDGKQQQVVPMLPSQLRRTTEEIRQKALEKSKLTSEEVAELSSIVGPYFTKRFVAANVQKDLERIEQALAEEEATGKAPDPRNQTRRETARKQLAEFAEFRKGFEQQYGRATVELLDRHEKEILELQRKRLAVIIGRE